MVKNRGNLLLQGIAGVLVPWHCAASLMVTTQEETSMSSRIGPKLLATSFSSNAVHIDPKLGLGLGDKIFDS